MCINKLNYHNKIYNYKNSKYKTMLSHPVLNT